MVVLRDAAFQVPAARPGRKDPAIRRFALRLPSCVLRFGDLRHHRQLAPSHLRFAFSDQDTFEATRKGRRANPERRTKMLCYEVRYGNDKGMKLLLVEVPAGPGGDAMNPRAETIAKTTERSD